MIQETLGQFVRRKRQEKHITLRAFAKATDLSATFISQFERGEFAAPSEEKIKNMAMVLQEDSDYMLALANKIPSDLAESINSFRLLNETGHLLFRKIASMQPDNAIKLNQYIDQLKKEKND